jgi:hypothetical protein
VAENVALLPKQKVEAVPEIVANKLPEFTCIIAVSDNVPVTQPVPVTETIFKPKFKLDAGMDKVILLPVPAVSPATGAPFTIAL